MKIIGANRRWMREYANRNFNMHISKSRAKNSKYIKSIIFAYKCTPIFPPLCLIYSFKTIWHCKSYSFYPSIPMRVNAKVALENYDALFDYNSLKRFIYSPLITLLLFFSKGKFEYFSLTSKKSMPNIIKYSTIGKRSTVNDFFQVNSSHLSNLLPQKNRPISISFVGCFFLKGGLELAHAISKCCDNEMLDVTFIVPKDQRLYVEGYLTTLAGIFTVLEFNETDPSLYYATLKNTRVLMHPTYYDSHAIVVREAAQLGCFTVSTDNFDSASFADVKLLPPINVFVSHRLRFPLVGQMFIRKYSNINRNVSQQLTDDLVRTINKFKDLGVL